MSLFVLLQLMFLKQKWKEIMPHYGFKRQLHSSKQQTTTSLLITWNVTSFDRNYGYSRFHWSIFSVISIWNYSLQHSKYYTRHKSNLCCWCPPTNDDQLHWINAVSNAFERKIVNQFPTAISRDYFQKCFKRNFAASLNNTSSLCK